MSQNLAIETFIDRALQIRASEMAMMELLKADEIHGTLHTCVGQELCAAALYDHLRPGTDAMFSNHRCHGHVIAHEAGPDGLLRELLARDGALCLGRGGSQHLHARRFFSNGIQGGIAPLGVGFAWAQKLRGEDALTVVHLGDGTLGEGAVYEAMTFAALLAVPLLFVLEHNGYAQSTETARTTPGDLPSRAAGFGVGFSRIDDHDPHALHRHLGEVVTRVRSGAGPILQVIDTRRLNPHSKGDDTRPPELIQQLWRDDPLQRLIDADDRARLCYQAHRENLSQRIAALRNEPCVPLRIDPADALPASPDPQAVRPAGDDQTRIAEQLNAALHAMMAERDDVVLLGEDLLDPYGGAFKVTRNLSTTCPERVFSTPIAESAIVGTANGLALAGLRPVAEIMFSDFATLAADQIINHLAKFFYMYGGAQTCPAVVRLVSGGGRGYGPTHSQCMESLFLGTPGLRVVALSRRHDPGPLLRAAVADDAPVLFVEPKRLYAQAPLLAPPLGLSLQPNEDAPAYPALRYAPADDDAEATLVTFGGMTDICEEAMRTLLIEEEISCEYIVLTQLSPLDVPEVIDSVRRTSRLVTVEEGPAGFGLGPGLVAHVGEALGRGVAARCVAAAAVPIPADRQLETLALPDAQNVLHAVEGVLEEDP